MIGEAAASLPRRDDTDVALAYLKEEQRRQRRRGPPRAETTWPVGAVRHAGLLLVVLAAVLPAGCKGKADGAKPKPTMTAGTKGPAPFSAEATHARSGWIGRIAKDPAAFKQLAGTSSGWAEYFKGEVRRSAGSFARSLEELSGPEDEAKRPVLRVGLGRAQYEVGALLADNGRLNLRFLREYFDGRAKRRPKDLVAKPSERLYHGVALLLSGETDRALPHLDAVVAAGDAAGPYGAQAQAWKGFADKAAGKDPKKLWKEAAQAGPEAADLVTYLQARTGTPPEAATAGGSPLRDRLRVGVEVYRGQHEAAETAAQGIAPKAPDQTDTIKALTGEAEAGEAELRYFSPVFLDDLGRSYLMRAKATLDGLGGCGDYWLGRVLEALGEGEQAAVAYERLGKGPTSAAPAGPTPFSCVAFSPFQELADLAFDGGLRAAALRGKRAAPEATDERLIRRAWRLAAGLTASADRSGAKEALAPLGDVPDDAQPIHAAVEEALEGHGSEGGVALVRKLRLIDGYANAVLRAKAVVAAKVGEHPLALALLESSHDNQHQDAVSSVNRPGYLLETGVVNWEVKRRRRAILHLDVLSGAYPELWQNIEFMKRVDAIEAVGDRSAPVMGN